MLANAPLEGLNFALFSLLNAPADAGSGMLLLGYVFAQDMIVVFPLMLLAAWFFGEESHKRIALNAACSVVLALVVNVLIGAIWPHPRPFMVPTGHTFLAHAADPSFPSDHMTLACAVSFMLLTSRVLRWQGAILGVLSLAIAWARIYMGVHFPLDMAGSVGVALATTWLIHRASGLTNRLWMWAYPLYRSLFSAAIKKGLFR